MGTLTVLGIDPGLASMGYAIANVDVAKRRMTKVRPIGLLKTVRSNVRALRITSDSLDRAITQARALQALVRDHRVNVIAYEIVAATPHILPAFSFGVMMGIAASLERPIVQLLPHEIKLAVTGDRHAPKEEIIRWAIARTARMKLAWPVSGKVNALKIEYEGKNVMLEAEHPADALAAIETAIRSDQFALACSIAGE